MIYKRRLFQGAKAPLIQNTLASKHLGEDELALPRRFLGYRMITGQAPIWVSKTILVWTCHLFILQPDTFQYIWHCALVLLLRASGAAHTGRLPRRKIFGGNISCKRTRWRRGEAPFWRARQIQTVGCRAPLNSSRAPSKNYKCNWWLGYTERHRFENGNSYIKLPFSNDLGFWQFFAFYYLTLKSPLVFSVHINFWWS